MIKLWINIVLAAKDVKELWGKKVRKWKISLP